MIDVAQTPVAGEPIGVRQSPRLETVFGVVIATLVVIGCGYLAYREYFAMGNAITGLLALVLGALTLVCMGRDLRRRQLNLMFWWLLVAAFEVVICVAFA